MCSRVTMPNGNVVLPLYHVEGETFTGYVVYGPDCNVPDAKRLGTFRGPNALADALTFARV